MKNLDTNLRLCGFAAIVATILISSSAHAVAQANVQNAQVVSTPAASGPGQTNLPNFSALSTPSDTLPPPPSTSGSGLSALIAITPQNSSSPVTLASPAAAGSPAVAASPFVAPDVEAYQIKYAPNTTIGDGIVNTNPVKPVGSPAATSASTVTTNVPIQGSQVNEAARATGTGTGTITPSKNVSIQGAQVNNPPIDNAGDAGNGGLNQHPGRKIKNKGQGQLSNAGAAGDDSGPKLHEGQHKKQERIQTQGQGGNGQGRHQFTQPQPQQQSGGGGKGKPKPTPAPH